MSDSAQDQAAESGGSGSGRRSRRRPIHGVLVAIEAPAFPEGHWVVDAIDINANGMGLVLPPELETETEVLLSFRLDDEVEFSRVPARVRHRDGLAGGLIFGPWEIQDRLALLEHLVSFYERLP